MLAIDAFISATAPQLPRRLFSGPSITMIGYGALAWQNMSAWRGVAGDRGGSAAAAHQRLCRC
jgi:hypothetical protein